MEFNKTIDKLWGKTKEVFHKGGREVVKVSKVGKIKLDASNLQRDRQRLLIELAEKVCAEVGEGKWDAGIVELADLKDKVAAIDAIQEKVNAAEAEIRNISA